ncbi:MAG: hypothetical protein QM774_00545 [Gordonia sp. (in: high G+C Gram-positive bacteria)]|uniref:hypothetical protein n=1 Tax=Gordonia sp. (in: high G+C Gram-positive bacteria) TaxID=84139 RepID=UPI0039E3FE9C
MTTAAYADLWWLPVGAGGHVAARTSRWWESWRARREHRRPRPLFHAALEVFDGVDRYAIEMAPAWGRGSHGDGVSKRMAPSDRKVCVSCGRYGDMWNSNSLIAWLLVTSGVDAASLAPPDGGSAPGGRCGLRGRTVVGPGRAGLR